MNTITERVSYLRGLAEGMKLSDKTDEGKMLLKIIDVIDDIADTLDDLILSQAETEAHLGDIDDDISSLEDEVFGDDDDDDDDEDLDFNEVECPHCGETIYFDDASFDLTDDFVCPNCDKSIYEGDEDEGEKQ